MTLSFRDVAEILKAIDDSSADEINIEVEGLRLAVSKRGAPAQIPPSAETTATQTTSGTKETAPVPQISPADTKTPSPDSSQAPPGHEILRAPMVGTFYRKPGPEDSPFVEVGSTVTKGDPLCLIEVMKLYTTIEATTSGEIVSIFAEDGALVDFDQQLFLIKTQAS